MISVKTVFMAITVAIDSYSYSYWLFTTRKPKVQPPLARERSK